MSGPQKITEMWAWICTEADGGEGVPAVNGPNGLVLPMVGADAARVHSLRSEAQWIAEKLGLPVRLVRFHTMEVIETLEPAPAGQGRPTDAGHD